MILQPYGAIFFASAGVLHAQLPDLTDTSRHSVVILRLRGTDEAGATMLDVLAEYAESLAERDSKLVIVTDNERMIQQFHRTRKVQIGASNLYLGTPVLGETLRRAYDDAVAWVDHHRHRQAGP